MKTTIMTLPFNIIRNIFTSLLIIFCASIGFSQPGHGPNKETRERIEAARIGHITQKLNLSPEQAEKFWPVFNEYSNKRKAFRQDLKKQFEGKKREDLTEEDKIKILDHQIEVKEKELALTKEYKDRFMKILSVDQMIALQQAEDEFRRMLLDRMKHRERGEKREFRDNERHEERNNNKKRP